MTAVREAHRRANLLRRHGFSQPSSSAAAITTQEEEKKEEEQQHQQERSSSRQGRHALVPPDADVVVDTNDNKQAFAFEQCSFVHIPSGAGEFDRSKVNIIRLGRKAAGNGIERR